MKYPVFWLVIIFLISCKKSESVKTPVLCTPAISYSGKVKAILVANCASSGCHDGNPLPSLADYITAHDAATQIKSAVNSGVMPKNAVLSQSDKSAITCWIENGAQNN